MPSPNGASAVRAMPASVDPLVRGLLAEYRWSSNALTFSFPAPGSTFSTSAGGYGSSGEPWSSSFRSLTGSDMARFTTALGAWSAVADLRFQLVPESATNVGDIRAAYTWLQAYDAYEAWAYLPAAVPAAGDIWFNAHASVAETEWRPGSGAYLTVLHEIGHALGLKHPFEDPYRLPANWDTQTFTVMSYSAVPGNPVSTYDYHPTTPMLLDILAIQHAYGANRTHEAGNSVYVYDDTRPYHETLWDAGGRDLLRYDGQLPALLDLRAGQGSRVGQPVHAYQQSGSQRVANVHIAFGVTLEDAIGGAGADELIGNEVANALQGGRGNDRFTCAGGNDTIVGGPGDDSIDGGAGRDICLYAGALGSYSIVRNGDRATVRDLTGAEGTDSLVAVERLNFGRDEIGLDVEGAAGQAYRLYKAALARTPDLPGLGHQIRTLDSGVSLAQVAAHFMESPEFRQKYGAPDNRGFVTLLYRNVLGREPDPQGLEFHVNRLESGVGRPDVLLGFSESPENQAAVIGVIGNGVHYVV